MKKKNRWKSKRLKNVLKNLMAWQMRKRMEGLANYFRKSLEIPFL